MKKTKPRICAVVCEQRASDLPGAIAAASKVTDIIELRLDCLPEAELASVSAGLPAWPAAAGGTTILTLRPAEFGGARAISMENRLAIRRNQWGHFRTAPGSLFWDVELDLALMLQEREKVGNLDVPSDLCDWTQTICSYHDFAGVPVDLNQLYESMAATNARVLKIAVRAADATDCLPVFRLLERAKSEGREMIAIAMGQAGVMTRILGPSRGAFLTYGSLEDESATAPGQLTARELREVYHLDDIDRQTGIFGLMGRPVSHSVSPHFQNAAFHAAGVNGVYLPFETIDVSAFMRRMVHPRSREIDWNLRGLSVTAPHKTAVMPHLDWIEPAAKEIGAVNTIVVAGDSLQGYNTDAAAFIAPLRSALGPLAKLKCAIIGSGGAARTAAWSLLQQEAEVSLYVRNPTSAAPMAKEFGIAVQELRDAAFSDVDVVVNATPMGTAGEGQDDTPAIAQQLSGVRLVYDFVYNPMETLFLREAARAGCQRIGGLEMLIAQAAAQFKLWTGQEAPTDVMRSAAARALDSDGTS
ncbi:MAG: shikimate dehydrogenase [Blastocatellia bacterium]|nr:shikimate dehydrogenase [Blastocatellia bacterium]